MYKMLFLLFNVYFFLLYILCKFIYGYADSQIRINHSLTVRSITVSYAFLIYVLLV
nr:MAG TPA: hypothetical protein [Caudoviricetes sp.]